MYVILATDSIIPKDRIMQGMNLLCKVYPFGTRRLPHLRAAGRSHPSGDHPAT